MASCAQHRHYRAVSDVRKRVARRSFQSRLVRPDAGMALWGHSGVGIRGGASCRSPRGTARRTVWDVGIDAFHERDGNDDDRRSDVYRSRRVITCTRHHAGNCHDRVERIGGASLLLGGLRYHEQTYNLYGANAFLAVILPLAVLGLILPSFTLSSLGPTLSPLQSTFLIVMSVGLYGVFLAIQTMRHRDYFVAPGAAAAAQPQGNETHGALEIQSARHHSILLLAYVLPIVLLAKQIAVPINYGISGLGAPAALGGLLVAVLILSPESLAAIRAARANQLQR